MKDGLLPRSADKPLGMAVTAGVGEMQEAGGSKIAPLDALLTGPDAN